MNITREKQLLKYELKSLQEKLLNDGFYGVCKNNNRTENAFEIENRIIKISRRLNDLNEKQEIYIS